MRVCQAADGQLLLRDFQVLFKLLLLCQARQLCRGREASTRSLCCSLKVTGWGCCCCSAKRGVEARERGARAWCLRQNPAGRLQQQPACMPVPNTSPAQRVQTQSALPSTPAAPINSPGRCALPPPTCQRRCAACYQLPELLHLLRCGVKACRQHMPAARGRVR